MATGISDGQGSLGIDGLTTKISWPRHSRTSEQWLCVKMVNYREVINKRETQITKP